MLLGAFAALIVVRAAVTARRDITLSGLQIGFVEQVRRRLAEKLAAAPWPVVSRLQHARVTNMLTGDIQRVGTAALFTVQLSTALVLTLCFILTIDAGRKGTRKSWRWLGAAWGFSALLNPALLSLMPFSFAHAAAANQKAWISYVRSLAVASLVFVAVISPWLIRNYSVFGRPVFLRDNFWFEFSLGNYHFSNGMGWASKHPDGNPAIGQQAIQLGELAFIEVHKREALGFVRKNPAEFLQLTAHRMLWFWDGTSLLYQGQEWWRPWEFWPLSFLAWLGLLFVLTRRPTGWILYAAALVIYPAPYYLTYPHAKYRYAIEPEMLLLGVYLASVVWGEIRRQRAPRS